MAVGGSALQCRFDRSAIWKNAEADTLNSQALRSMQQMNDSHARAFLLLTAGLTDLQLSLTVKENGNRLLLRGRALVFRTSPEYQSERLGDKRVETYALASIPGRFHEKNGRETDSGGDGAPRFGAIIYCAEEARCRKRCIGGNGNPGGC